MKEFIRVVRYGKTRGVECDKQFRIGTMANTKKGKVTGARKGKGASNRGRSSSLRDLAASRQQIEAERMRMF